MFNPDLQLNEKLFDEDVQLQPTRNGYGEGLLALGQQDPNIVVMTADLNESTRCEKFAAAFPDRFFDVGVAEQNMAAVAAGLGVTGKTVFITSYATFSPGKNWETIRTTIVYNQSNVKIAGHHSGIVTGPDGATHQATEDIAIMRALPDIQVIVPCDSIEAKKATISAGQIEGPVYLRFTRDKTPIMTTDKTPFAAGKIQTFWTNENPQVTIYGTGHLLYYALLAAKELEKENISVLVVNVATIKPLDTEGILASIETSQAAVSVEDHQVIGGLSGALAELFSLHKPVPMEFIGLQNTFAESGSAKELIEAYGLGKNAIIAAVKKVIKRK